MKLTINIISETPFTVQGHGVHTAFVEAVEAFKKIGLNVLTNSNEPCDIMHVHTIGPYALTKILRNRKKYKKLVITAHVIPDSFVGSIVGSRYWLPLARRYLKFFYGLANAIIAVSPDVKKELEKMHIDKKIFFIPNSVNPEKFKHSDEDRKKIRTKLHLKPKEFVVMNTGQIQPRKGIESFVNTAHDLPDVTFIWIGGMPFKKLAADHVAMENLMKNAPKNVIFPGIVPYEEMPAYYSAGDVLFFPSYQENFPFSILEAAAAGLPIILRDIDLYRPIFGDNYIKATDSTFTDEIIRLKKDTQHYNEYRTKSGGIAKRYDSTTTARELLEIYKTL